MAGVAVVLLGALGVAPRVEAGESAAARAQEYDLKAVFLFNFAQFVTWPEEAFEDVKAPLVIGVLGEDPFGSSLDEVLANEQAAGRKLVVRRAADANHVGPVHILFVSRSEEKRVDPTLLRRRGVLTVGDTKGFAARDGIIGFVRSGDRLRLQINLVAAQAAGLTISSMLLRQAEIVKPEKSQ